MMKQKLSWRDDFAIKDESGQGRFRVYGKVLGWVNQLSFQDLAGQELCFIRPAGTSWGPSYGIYKSGQLWATVKKELFTFFNCRFEVEGDGSNHIEASGDFTDHRYEFNRSGRIIAQVSKEWFTLTNTYGVDILEGEDDILILASTVVIDLARHHY